MSKRSNHSHTFFFFLLIGSLALSGCTQIITAPISVTSSVVEAGFNMVGAAGGAVVHTVTGGDDEED
jgi:uncharacterized protein YceK